MFWWYVLMTLVFLGVFALVVDAIFELVKMWKEVE